VQVETLFFAIQLVYLVVFVVGIATEVIKDMKAHNQTVDGSPVVIKAGSLVRSLYTEPRIWGVVIKSSGRTIRVLLDDGRLVKCTSNQVEAVCK